MRRLLPAFLLGLLMAISFIGSAEGSATNGGNVTLTLPAMIQNDLVIVTYGIGDNDDVDFIMAMVTAGYTKVADLFANDVQDTNLAVFWKVMGATPDTTAEVDGQGGADAAVPAVCMVFRGVDPTTPMDVTPTTATGIDTMHPNPPSIDPLNPTGLWTVIVGASGHTLGGAGTYTFPTGYVTNAIDRVADDASDCIVGMGYRTNPADPEDPGVMTHSGTDSANFSWAAVTLALRVAPTGPEVISATDSGAVIASEVADRLLASLNPVESSPAGLTEVADRLLASLNPAESSPVGLSEAIDVGPHFDAAESAQLGFAEATALALVADAAETLTAILVEQLDARLVRVDPTDSLGLITAEVIDALAARIAPGEALVLGETDTAAALSALDLADSLSARTTETEVLVLRAEIVESLSIAATEAASAPRIGVDSAETWVVILALEQVVGTVLLVEVESFRVVFDGTGEGAVISTGARHYCLLSHPQSHIAAGGPP